MSDARVFVGAWLNWDAGRFRGGTITIPAEYGSVLVAVLALFVRWAGSHLWNITCFAIHQLRSTPHERDGLHHQYQAILRSGLSDSSALWQFARAARAWRSSTKNTKRRALPLLLLTTVHIAALYTAGIFSSRVVKPGGEVLVKSDICGWPDDRSAKDFSQWSGDDMESADALMTTLDQGFQKSSAYARSCYGTLPGTQTTVCNAYIAKSIQSTVDRAAPCPFTEGACTNASIAIDSGLIDSHVHLGINAPAQDRVQFRRITTCAPIPVEERYSSNWTSEITPDLQNQLLLQQGQSLLLPGDSYKHYHLGDRTWNGALVGNSTFVMSNNTIMYASQPYNLLLVDAHAGSPSEGTFKPMTVFNRTDADVYVLALNNLVAYTGPVTDPWFQTAAEPIDSLAWAPDGVWMSQNTLSGIGCIEQYQFCHTKGCTPLTAISLIDQGTIDALELNPRQAATVKLLFEVARWMRLNAMLNFLGGDILLAKERLFGGLWLSSVLEDSQWQREVENIHDTSMAFLQQSIVDHSSPPNSRIYQSVKLYDYIVREENAEARHLCANQKIRSTVHYSVNISGFVLIIIGGILVVIVNIFLPHYVGKLQHRSEKGEAARLDWLESDTFQLQRAAFEARGIGPWKSKGDGVPVTAEYGQRFRGTKLHPSHDGATQLSELSNPLIELAKTDKNQNSLF